MSLEPKLFVMLKHLFLSCLGLWAVCTVLLLYSVVVAVSRMLWALWMNGCRRSSTLRSSDSISASSAGLGWLEGERHNQPEDRKHTYIWTNEVIFPSKIRENWFKIYTDEVWASEFVSLGSWLWSRSLWLSRRRRRRRWGGCWRWGGVHGLGWGRWSGGGGWRWGRRRSGGSRSRLGLSGGVTRPTLKTEPSRAERGSQRSLNPWRLNSDLHPADDIVNVSQQVLSQHQPQPGLALHRLVHVDVHVYRPVALQRQQQQLEQPPRHAVQHPAAVGRTPVLVVTLAFLVLSPNPDTICWTVIWIRTMSQV